MFKCQKSNEISCDFGIIPFHNTLSRRTHFKEEKNYIKQTKKNKAIQDQKNKT